MSSKIWPALTVGTWILSVSGLFHCLYTIENNKKHYYQRFLKKEELSNQEVNTQLKHLWGPELKSRN